MWKIFKENPVTAVLLVFVGLAYVFNIFAAVYALLLPDNGLFNTIIIFCAILFNGCILLMIMSLFFEAQKDVNVIVSEKIYKPKKYIGSLIILFLYCVFCALMFLYANFDFIRPNFQLAYFYFIFSAFVRRNEMIVTDKGVGMGSAFIKYDKIAKCEIIDREGQGKMYPFISIKTKGKSWGERYLKFSDKNKIPVAYEYITSLMNIGNINNSDENK